MLALIAGGIEEFNAGEILPAASWITNIGKVD